MVCIRRTFQGFSKTNGNDLDGLYYAGKIQVSCNLLKYSNRSIAIIAEYMNLSPQSYFTRVFKEGDRRDTGTVPKNSCGEKFFDN